MREKTNKECADILKRQVAYGSIHNPLFPLNIDRDELWPAINRAIDILDSTDDSLAAVIRCKDCGYFHSRQSYCDRPCESPVFRDPYDFCSKGRRRRMLGGAIDKLESED